MTGLFFGMSFVGASSGACSGHGGVDCSRGADSDGSVICVDGWRNSSVQYSFEKKCQGASVSSSYTSYSESQRLEDLRKQEEKRKQEEIRLQEELKERQEIERKKELEEQKRMEEHHRMMEAKMAEMETITEEERRAREAKMEEKHMHMTEEERRAKEGKMMEKETPMTEAERQRYMEEKMAGMSEEERRRYMLKMQQEQEYQDALRRRAMEFKAGDGKELSPEEVRRLMLEREAKAQETKEYTAEELARKEAMRRAELEKKYAAVDATTLMAARRAMRDLDSTPHRDAIAELHRRGIVGGYADGTYRPAAGVNRAEMLKMIMESKYTVDPSYAQKSCFSDVPAGEWYTAAICYAAAKGIVQGYPDGTFRPEERVRYAEALKITLATYGVGPEEVKDEVNAPWYRGYERRARGMNMDLPVAPDHGMDRGQMAEMLHRLLRAKGY